MTTYVNVPTPDGFWEGTFVQRVKIEGDWVTKTFTGCEDFTHSLIMDDWFRKTEDTVIEGEKIVVFSAEDAEPFVVNRVFCGTYELNASQSYDLWRLMIGPCVFHEYRTKV